MPLQLTLLDIKAALFAWGYYDGKMDRVIDDNFRDDLRRYQRDMGLVPDGAYGPKTDAKLAPQWALVEKLRGCNRLPADSSARRWHLTYYYIGDQRRFSGMRTIPMRTKTGKLVANVEPRCFVEASLEGTTVLRDGRMMNVAGVSLPEKPAVLQPVYNIAKAAKWLPDLAGYAGIGLSKDGSQAVRSFTFMQIAPGDQGWPLWQKIQAQPYKTLAADLGTHRRHDPKWKGKGGLVPVGTKPIIFEFIGDEVPDGPFDQAPPELAEHDGGCLVNDTGGGIFGAHFDVFVGTWDRGPPGGGPAVPDRAHIWFDGIEKRIPMNYTYGL